MERYAEVSRFTGSRMEYHLFNTYKEATDWLGDRHWVKCGSGYDVWTVQARTWSKENVAQNNVTVH